MTEKFTRHSKEKEKFPTVVIKCQTCGKRFIGKIGSLDKNHAIYPQTGRTRLLDNLIKHHRKQKNSDGSFSGGHYKFTVFHIFQKIGELRVSTTIQNFIKT